MSTTLQHIKDLNGHTALARFLATVKDTKEKHVMGEHNHCAGVECGCAKRVSVDKAGRKLIVLDVPYATRYRVMQLVEAP